LFLYLKSNRCDLILITFPKIAAMKKYVVAVGILASFSLNGQEFINDLDVALKEARDQDKKIILLFSTDDACAVCQDLEANVFDSQEFKAYAKDHYILVKPDFQESAPLETKTDNLLIVEKYNKDGFFPHVVVLDKSAKVIVKMAVYNNEPTKAYLKLLQGF